MQIAHGIFTACKASIMFLVNAVIFFFIPEDEDEIEADVPEGMSPHGSNSYFGEYNFRTRKMDNGSDPYGWYEEDM